jgi:hypothetical protein
VVMAWYGVNFVLGAGLHSYGFSTGGRGSVAALTLLQFAYVGGASWLRSRMRSAAKPGSESLTQTSQASGT